MKTNVVILGDVLDVLATIPDSSAQLVIADPPYNLGPKFGISREWIRDSEWLDWSKSWLEECKRILSPDGNLFVYGIHHYLCYIQVALYDLDMKYRRQIIWNYENGFSTPRKNLATHYEPLLWFSKTDQYYFEPIREPYKSVDRLKHKVIKNGKVWEPHPEGRIAGDVWQFPTLAGKRFASERTSHPTQKPLGLTDRIVQHFSSAGSLVVAPFAGSGTECLSAFQNGRRYVGIEINPSYVQLAEARIKEGIDTAIFQESSQD